MGRELSETGVVLEGLQGAVEKAKDTLTKMALSRPTYETADRWLRRIEPDLPGTYQATLQEQVDGPLLRSIVQEVRKDIKKQAMEQTINGREDQ